MNKEQVKNLTENNITDLEALTNTEFGRFPNNKGIVFLNDPFCVGFNVALFCDSTMSLSKRLQTFDFLLKTTSNNVLLPYRNQIIPLLSWNRLSTESKAKMAALLNFTKAERNRLFGEKQEFPLSVLARFGDKNAIKKLIAEFDSAQGYEPKRVAKLLAYII